MKKYFRLFLKLSKYLLIVPIVGLIGLFYITSLRHTDVGINAPKKEAVAEREAPPQQEEQTLLSLLSDELSSSRGKTVERDNAPSHCKITILDVGQASCALIESNGEYMLFDGGDRGTSSYLVAYLKERGISHIKYLVASHYHADHVYGLVGVVEAGITYDAVICPYYETGVYAKEALFQRIDEAKVIEPYVTQTFEIGDITAKCICPVSDAYSDDNGYSVGMIFQYKNLSVLIDGDATAETEADMLESGIDISADILVIPHHGSTYSSSGDWLEAVGAAQGIVSCGLDNEYGHPHFSTLQRLKAAGMETLYRTDLQGMVEITYDDEKGIYEVNTQKKCEEDRLWLSGSDAAKQDVHLSDVWEASGEAESYYIGNTASKRFHRPSCEQLPSEKRRILFSTREDALGKKYVPCTVCQP